MEEDKPVCEVNPPHIFEHPHKVKCPCGCKDGVLQTDGKNTQDTLTFLICSSCQCCYIAENRLVTEK